MILIMPLDPAKIVTEYICPGCPRPSVTLLCIIVINVIYFIYSEMQTISKISHSFPSPLNETTNRILVTNFEAFVYCNNFFRELFTSVPGYPSTSLPCGLVSLFPPNSANLYRNLLYMLFPQLPIYMIPR